MPMQRGVLRRPEVSGSPEGGSGSTRTGVRTQMSRPLRSLTFCAGALLWTTGVVWLVLHFGFAQRSPFGPLPNPWEPTVMRVHGLLAVAGVFLLGWITAGHMSERWRSRPRRISGLVLAASGAILIVSGYALYYTTGSPHELAALAHEVLGAAALIVALTHWWRRRTAR